MNDFYITYYYTMSSYIMCPTCNRLLADKIIPYEIGLKKICDDESLSQEEKTKKKEELVNSLKIPPQNYCCKMRLITYRDLAKIVK